MHVLIVDDENDIRKLIQMYLAPYAECDTAGDGKEAVQKFVAHMKTKHKYDLILLDIMMPGMNGQEVLEHIRGLEESLGIDGVDGVKVIMLTALDDTKNVIHSFKHHCDSYVIKPFDDEKLLKEIGDLGLLAK